jgi:hypothetical protein
MPRRAVARVAVCGAMSARPASPYTARGVLRRSYRRSRSGSLAMFAAIRRA